MSDGALALIILAAGLWVLVAGAAWLIAELDGSCTPRFTRRAVTWPLWLLPWLLVAGIPRAVRFLARELAPTTKDAALMMIGRDEEDG